MSPNLRNSLLKCVFNLVILTRVVIMAGPYVPPDDVRFGCTFPINSLFSLEIKPTDPVWGKFIAPLELRDQEFLEQVFIKNINMLYKRYIEEHEVFNSVVGFMDLIHKHQVEQWQRTGVTFETFFENYFPPYRTHLDTVGQCTGLLERIVEDLENVHPGIKDSTYMASVQSDVVPATIRQVTETRRPVPNHVVVAIKIMVNNEYGYVILDPGNHLGKAFVVMEKKVLTPQEMTEKSEIAPQAFKLEDGKTWTYKYFSASDQADYIGGQVLSPDRFWSIKDVNSKDLLYMGYAYCSFRQLTGKQMLLDPQRTILRRNNNGELIASFSFNIQEQEPTFVFKYIDENNVVQTHPIKFETVLSKDDKTTLTAEDNAIIKKVTEKLNLNENSFITDLNAICSFYNKNSEAVKTLEKIKENIKLLVTVTLPVEETQRGVCPLIAIGRRLFKKKGPCA